MWTVTSSYLEIRNATVYSLDVLVSFFITGAKTPNKNNAEEERIIWLVVSEVHCISGRVRGSGPEVRRKTRAEGRAEASSSGLGKKEAERALLTKDKIRTPRSHRSDRLPQPHLTVSTTAQLVPTRGHLTDEAEARITRSFHFCASLQHPPTPGASGGHSGLSHHT